LLTINQSQQHKLPMTAPFCSKKTIVKIEETQAKHVMGGVRSVNRKTWF